MAATISTDTTLRAAFLILQSELDALIDAADFSGDTSVGFHTSVWTQIQRDLLKRRPGLTESDISDTSVLQHAAHLLCLARLYEMSEIESNRIESARWWSEYRQEMREVNIDDNAAAGDETMILRA